MDACEPFDTHLTPDEAHGRLVTTPWGAVGVFRRADGSFVAVDAWCPHLDGPLWEGSFGGEDELACPWHKWRYSLRTGACTWAPPHDADEARASSVRVTPLAVGPRGTLVVAAGRGPA